MRQENRWVLYNPRLILLNVLFMSICTAGMIWESFETAIFTTVSQQAETFDIFICLEPEIISVSLIHRQKIEIICEQ